MAVTAYWYAGAFIQAFDKEIDFLADSMKVMLTTSTYTPNQDTHDYKDDVTNEVTGTGYTAGGEALTTPTNTNTLNVVTFDAADTAWASSTITARLAVLYDATPASDATRPLMLWVDFGQNESSSSGTFTIQWNASGIATITATDATGFP